MVGAFKRSCAVIEFIFIAGVDIASFPTEEVDLIFELSF